MRITVRLLTLSFFYVWINPNLLIFPAQTKDRAWFPEKRDSCYEIKEIKGTDTVLFKEKRMH